MMAYVRGDGLSFTPTVIWKAPHANWGSSGLSMADLDADGDLDFLLANGDTFDDSLLKPYHGLAWLERTGLGAGARCLCAPPARRLAGSARPRGHRP